MIKLAVHILERKINNFRKTHPHVGLPEELFLFVSRLTPIVNVDLLIKDEGGRVLLGWRDDRFVGAGWHVPGGIIRYKEGLEDRVNKVAQIEIGTPVAFESQPIAFNQVMRPHASRGHFISFLYNCRLPSTTSININGTKPGEVGYLKWHCECPPDLVGVHEMYREFINKNFSFHR